MKRVIAIITGIVLALVILWTFGILNKIPVIGKAIPESPIGSKVEKPFIKTFKIKGTERIFLRFPEGHRLLTVEINIEKPGRLGIEYGEIGCAIGVYKTLPNTKVNITYSWINKSHVLLSVFINDELICKALIEKILEAGYHKVFEFKKILYCKKDFECKVILQHTTEICLGFKEDHKKIRKCVYPKSFLVKGENIKISAACHGSEVMSRITSYTDTASVKVTVIAR